MGLFSGKKKIYVSSTVYNLAGDQKERIQFLPSVVSTKVISNSNFDMGETIVAALKNGPGYRLRRFVLWAKVYGYMDSIEQVGSWISADTKLDVNVVMEHLPLDAGETASVHSTEIGRAEYSYWVDQWMSINHPDEMDADYVANFDEVANLITLRFPGGKVYSFTPVGLNLQSIYLYANYVRVREGTPQVEQKGDVFFVSSPTDFPDVSSYAENYFVGSNRTVDLTDTTTTVVTYSDDRPGTTSTESTEHSDTFRETTGRYEITEYKGLNEAGDATTSLRTVQNLFTRGAVHEDTETTVLETTLTDGTVQTTTTTTVIQSLVPEYSYRTDTQVIIDKRYSPMNVFIYERNTGVYELDQLFWSDFYSTGYFPFIPIRQDERFLSEKFHPDIYDQNFKALKKALDYKYDDLLDKIKDNDDIGDVDHCYAVFGVALNAQDNSAKKYIYKFFETIYSEGNPLYQLETFREDWALADFSQRAWRDWRDAQADINSPLYGEPEPTRIPYPTLPKKTLWLYSTKLSYDMELGWSGITLVTHEGRYKPDAQNGTVWIEEGSATTLSQLVHTGGSTKEETVTLEGTLITYQETATTYKQFIITGLFHNNIIYKSKGIWTSASSALRDPEESGFIVPLHEGVFRALSLKDATQASTACCYLIFNSYEEVKQKWYQTGVFKIIVVIVIIIVSIYFPPAAGAGAGILGTAAAVGAALGFTGAMAILVGTVANLIAGMLLAQIIMRASVALFGEKWGQIIGTIASVIALNVGTSMATGGGMATSFSELARADNLLKLTVAAGNGYAGYLNAETQEILNETQDFLNEYADASGKIAEQWKDLLGFGINLLDPMELIDVSSPLETFIPENTNTFLSRTLMTGSEIADMTNGMITNFASLTITTNLII